MLLRRQMTICFFSKKSSGAQSTTVFYYNFTSNRIYRCRHDPVRLRDTREGKIQRWGMPYYGTDCRDRPLLLPRTPCRGRSIRLPGSDTERDAQYGSQRRCPRKQSDTVPHPRRKARLTFCRRCCREYPSSCSSNSNGSSRPAHAP